MEHEERIQLENVGIKHTFKHTFYGKLWEKKISIGYMQK